MLMGMRLEVKQELHNKQQEIKNILKLKLILLHQFFQHQNPKYTLVVLMESKPKTASEYIYKYRHKKGFI